MKKIALIVLCLALLSGCTLSIKNNTRSNTTTIGSTSETATETPTAEPVAGVKNLSSSKVIWGPGNIKEHRRPDEPAGLQEKYAELSARWLLDDEKKLCLTFDEGYENGFTPSILDTLKEKDVKAVFFVTYDFAKDNGDLIQRMIDEGHTVGNHTYRHYSMDELDTDTATEEVIFLHNYIKDNFNYTMSYFRFPKGEFSEKTLDLLQSLDYESIFWSFAYADWDTSSQQNPAEALRHITDSVHPGEIMLLHAVSKTNAEILGDVIDSVREQGYEFTTEL